MAKNTICLWYDKDAEAAARFYAETFPDSSVGAVHRAPSGLPVRQAGRRADSRIHRRRRLLSRPSTAVLCSSITKPFSFQIATEDQEETDLYWNAIVGNGGQESACERPTGMKKRERCYERLARYLRIVGYWRFVPVPQRPRAGARRIRLRLVVPLSTTW
jgi:predicted 3-demethylubiquinone-9 3-methyltransferase (glyoxalase superfamily)